MKLENAKVLSPTYREASSAHRMLCAKGSSVAMRAGAAMPMPMTTAAPPVSRLASSELSKLTAAQACQGSDKHSSSIGHCLGKKEP